MTVNASKLLRQAKVLDRVAELQGFGAAAVEVTVASILADLAEDRALARELGMVSVAVAASMGRAKVAGLIVERKELGDPGDFSRMNANELREHIAKEATELGLGDLTLATLAASPAPGGKPH